MFKVERFTNSAYNILDEAGNSLHSDGSIYDVTEYFPDDRTAQAVLDKFYPKPKHVWENGDVFISGSGCPTPMIYMHYSTNRRDQVFSLDKNIGGPALCIEACMKGAKFLFNIKEKI